MKQTGLFLIALVISLAVNGQTNKILFVCEHGSAKSVIAATYFNKLASERNLPWEAITRGTNPDSSLSTNTERGLKDDHRLTKKVVPQKVSQQDIADVKQVILFFPLPNDIQPNAHSQFWNGLPPVSEDYQKARDAIVSKVNILIDSLTKRSK